ncbi:TRAP-type mannitol/chloroaromatic compound transport system, substrate-binding protein [Allopseudospirillum japonicum]|uniref:TRAP-type mannitol/chloroaromatic compound transport system, substrate-binding protein n=1 Tax=Allopseudospirillum japonicum TaxID=64971 RepID=A0A1H6RMG2_9GAMM|nr:TRAP transporter substrate-binding protein [Allopseudospirillum japonicum]SEI55666.1 TRAP-type mannitol/chloroaromatic compound transport system, substrate-binding protein [Allopseudospirillum japonicum]
MSSFVKTTLAAALASSLTLGMQASAQAADLDRIQLKVPIAFSTQLPGLGSPIAKVADKIQKVSNNTLRFKVYEPGKLVAPFEILDAVSRGKVDAGYATAGYWAGKIPASPLFSAIPFGPEAGEYIAWMYYGNGMKLYQKMYDQAGYHVKVLPCTLNAPETSGWFTKPIEKPEDLQGLRMRFFGLGAKVMEKLGVATSLLPGAEIFPALEKGAIDATEFSMPAVDARQGFYKIAKYNYFPGWHQQATIFELLINKDVWNKMHENQQVMVEEVCKASMADSFAEGEALQFKVLMENAEKHGVQIMRWNDTMLAAFRQAWEEVAQEEAAKDAFFKEVWDDLSQFRAQYELWERNAFLPREF